MSRVVHFEIQADDVERAKSFYAAVFDWSFEDYSQYTGSTYWGAMTGPEKQPASTEACCGGPPPRRP
jgi:predicted enzyme related to lactoylglutathione lyase